MKRLIVLMIWAGLVAPSFVFADCGAGGQEAPVTPFYGCYGGAGSTLYKQSGYYCTSGTMNCTEGTPANWGVPVCVNNTTVGTCPDCAAACQPFDLSSGGGSGGCGTGAPVCQSGSCVAADCQNSGTQTCGTGQTCVSNSC